MLELNKIYHGDCTELMKMIDNNSIDLILTDPPYGVNLGGRTLISRMEVALGEDRGNREPRPVANDDEYAIELYRTLVNEASRILKPSGVICCCCAGGGSHENTHFVDWITEMKEVLKFHQIIVWDKGKIGTGWKYRRSYEFVIVGHKGDKMAWYDTSRQVENIIRDIPKIIPRKDQHPTQKPVALMEHFIKLHTKEGDVVLDPFIGAGSTAVACVNLNRHFIGIELDEHWYNVACNRVNDAIANETSKQPLF